VAQFDVYRLASKVAPLVIEAAHRDDITSALDLLLFGF
jgi:hypothetical protein